MLSSLYARTGGYCDPTVVLLHGLLASGYMFGADYDTLAARYRVVVPDLLGFGRSLDSARTEFSPADHLDALDDLLAQAGASYGPLIIGAHSMGAALALRWAERNADRIRQVVCWGAPLYRDETAARAAITSTGLMARLFTTDTATARCLCGWSCEHRATAGWIAAASTPSLPIAISRAASLHTWDAYRDATTALVMNTNWDALISELAAKAVSVRFVWGSNDPIGDRSLAVAMERSHPSVRVDVTLGADQHLPISHPYVCMADLVDVN